ncbi:preprotein translocase subunit SecE [Ruania halotolerans]|uniref:preprotein translocase subunit SecE n=1 Tax=Ruania halotolerans TaxID=2897773 RepID=UPI00338D3BB3
MSNSTNADSGEPDDVGRGDDARNGDDASERENAAADTGATDSREQSESSSDEEAAAVAPRPPREKRTPSSVRASEGGKGRRTASRSEAEAARTAEPNAFARIWRFIRQVIAELRKVVTPTRTELLTYVAVVIVFLIVMMAYVGVLDYGFGQLVLWAFGG